MRLPLCKRELRSTFAYLSAPCSIKERAHIDSNCTEGGALQIIETKFSPDPTWSPSKSTIQFFSKTINCLNNFYVIKIQNSLKSTVCYFKMKYSFILYIKGTIKKIIYACMQFFRLVFRRYAVRITAGLLAILAARSFPQSRQVIIPWMTPLQPSLKYLFTIYDQLFNLLDTSTFYTHCSQTGAFKKHNKQSLYLMLSVTVFWIVMTCGLARRYQRFGGKKCLPLHDHHSYLHSR